MNNLVQKYNVPGPRYTSYPTVPYWDSSNFTASNWNQLLVDSFKKHNSTDGISLYIHLPFCESLCTFCGCNKRITKRHEVENPYIEALLKEWQLYVQLLPEKPLIKEIHLGGGTPTFFSPENLTHLINGIKKNSTISKDHAFSFEGHPNNTTEEHLQALYNVGFRRVSYGVQDYNMAVQIAIHRIQPFENVKKATDLARKIGYTSVGHDIIFGLPMQTLNHVKETIQKTKELLPDRIAFYSYAHVPWIKGNGQRGFDEKDLPTPQLKSQLYEVGKKMLEEIGYTEIGMDHFALPTDSLYEAMENKKLHRNFMGYTTTQTKIMIGLGVSSISDSWNAFAQNVKTIEEYYQMLEQDKIPVFRGHFLNKEDQVIRQHILNLMCQLETSWQEDKLYFPELPSILENLTEMQEDGLLLIEKSALKITEKGRPFVRNVCMAFDLLLQRHQPETQLFSMTV
ncbi:MAG: oxygen-independent coproporphyrinogen III oxidase [Flavobacteriaceae bacterium CG2_30_34_30]|nr:MAG: oxygen-independent coproporphyrinogen III oxidase [Flavobacteriaceae bacterium CG2_30_34_30]PIQ18010.1 MAG: oxygen-independent coproporphyrinogen III oxidase [Flavobacteriaceae bacterium CG18_big_fil_WC_8_21_14_2_50_34_36]PIV51509.1 MAG: oxygen-independent coproporphyrinogen III oxidase [Flavobacteriaceae bacterium CG02_land_8_20_14_3_00_34_13]PIZ07359.1 MAG: oxygen-independent coproporphyrinogen III oxidase [Flavobacteriaceae bacterium CG_4_10_14_0_8_um_filter_34_31]PJC06118.1 MAG: oxy